MKRTVAFSALFFLWSCGGDSSPTASTPTPTPVATSITLSATSLSFASLGDTTQITATVKDQNGATMASAAVTWATSDAAVATVSSTGLVTSVANGSATITATSGSASATASVVNLNPECGKPYYAKKPDPVSSDGTHRYYEYYWQSAPKVCVNFYEPDLIDDVWETKIKDGLDFGKTQLGLLVPINAMVVDQKNASQATLAQMDRDTCDIWRVPAGQTLQNCLANPDPWGNRFPAAGVDHESLPNGGELHFFQDMITDFENAGNPGTIVRILMHEFYHVYQNSTKFYFEATQRFGIPKRWEDDPDTYLHDTDFVAVFPNWIEEGGADFAGIVLATKFDNSIDAQQDWLDHLDEARNVVRVAADKGDVVSLKDYEYQGGLYESPQNPNNGIAREFAYQYSGGAVALAYLWSLDDRNFKKIMVDYYRDYAEKDHANLGSGWKDSFEDLFGMTLDQFYTDFDAFMLQDRATQVTIFKTNLEIQQAPIS